METLEGDLCDSDMVNLESRLLKLIYSNSLHLFENISTLQVVDVSRTNIQSLPPSVCKLSALVNFTLQECSLLTELPPEIGTLKNLKTFDLEGTEIMYLPKEMGNLENLQCLRVSLCTYADDYKDSNGIENIIPRTIISNLMKLEELSIGVNPDAKWWEVELVEAILGKLHKLSCLKTLKLYFPTAKELQYFLRLENGQPPMYSSLRDFRLKVGHSEQLTSCLPSKLVESFDQLEKCLKCENGEASIDEIKELIGHANALFMCRHWTLEKLSIFDISRLKYCLVAECNEMHTIIDADELYGDKGITFDYDHKKNAFESLEYLAIHSMKNLQSIWKGPIAINSFSLLQVLALHTCPELTTVFTEGMLNKLNRLTVLIVEDCPKVNSLASRESTSTHESYGPFLPNLRNILLLDLPELVSISSGVCIAPRLDTLLIFNCLKLDDLSRAGLANVREIKGETEWWDALKGRQLGYSRAFVPLKRDGDLMNQLSEDANSLQQFCKLQCQNQQKNEPPVIRASISDVMGEYMTRMKIFNTDQLKNEPPVMPASKKSVSSLMNENMTQGNIFSWNIFSEGKDDLERPVSFTKLKPTEYPQSAKTIPKGKRKVSDAVQDDMEKGGSWRRVTESKERVNPIDQAVDHGLSNPWSTFQLIMGQHSRNREVREDDYLKRTTMSLEVISCLRSIAEKASSTGNIERCVDIYIYERKKILQMILPFNFKIGTRDGAQKFEWGVLEYLIEDWINSVKVYLAYLFASEKELCKKIFQGLGTTMEDILYTVIIKDYEIQVSDIMYAMSLGNPPPDKLFMILDLYETLDRFLSEMRVVIKPSEPTFGTQLFPVLADKITNSLSLFEMVLLYHESSVIFVGPVDPLPEYVMSYLYQLCDHQHALMKLSLPTLPSIDADDLTSLYHEEFKGQSDLSRHVIWIIMMLVSNLESKAKQCEDGSAGHFFAMKNIGYIVEKSKGHSELMEVVGDDYLGKLFQKLNLIKVKYLMLEIEKMRDMRNYSVMV